MTASPIVALHISAGTIALIFGGVALFTRKGSGWHRWTGKAFVISMVIMAGSASVQAFLIKEWSNFLTGFTTIYFVATAWMTLLRKDNETGPFEIVAFLVAVAGVAGNLAIALIASNRENGAFDGIPGGMFYVFMIVMALFAFGDLRLILRGGIAGAQRIKRHLIRMCYAVWVAAGSLFLGQMQVIPEFVRNTGIHFVLPFVPLIMMLFWVLRVRFTKWRKKIQLQLGTQFSAISEK